MNVADIRRTFLQFFESQGHSRVASSSLVPGNDPTLLFTNSGMVQFKDVFLGVETRPYRRATSAQRCVRAGGKHNDLENVGYTARHHTFFEMLGNFSFGDYFKRDAIHFAWTLLTRDLKLPAQKLWVTVYHNDDEAYRLWADEIGVPPERIVRIGDNKGAPYASDNFWQMADTGPCGPCSEVFYDHGPEVAGGPPGSPDADGDRYIEIWNLVFMQYDRDAQGVLHPLPKPCVDTGMGLERVAAVLQGVHSNYEIDLFRHLIEAAARATHTDDIHHDSLKVIADHIRACAFLLIDGVIPSNEGRGYVLRRIIRRALRHGHKLGCDTPFFHTLIPALAEQMGDAYPELRAQADRLAQTLLAEEKRFGETLDKGMGLLNEAIARLEAAATNPNAPLVLDGATVFTLYDTFGFPVDLTADILRERNIGFDEPGFDVAMARQRQQAKAASRFKSATALSYQGAPTAFVGYDRLTQESEVIALYVDGVAAEQAHSGDNVVVVLSDTPFYAESGGQVGDAGELTNNQCRIDIHDTQKIQAGVFGHHGVVRQGSLEVGQRITATVNGTQRAAAARNHSATHLLHAALRAELGSHVQQKGSLVDAERTRFDFSHSAPLAPEQLQAIEMRVNQAIQRNAPVAAQLMPYDQALQAGALALFGEKYGDEVRVIGMDDLSTELCGGTHVQRTGDIGLFKVLSESGVAAGIRRIEATTGSTALAQVQALDRQWHTLARHLKTPPAEVPARVAALLEQLRQLAREHEQLKSKLAAGQGNDLLAQAVEVGDVQVLAVALENADAKTLRTTLDQLKSQWPRCVVVLAGVENDNNRVALVAGVSGTLTAQLKAGELVNFVAQQVGGKGGGRADMAMAGGMNPAALPEALKSVAAWVRERL